MIVVFTLRLQQAFSVYTHTCVDQDSLEVWLQFFSVELVRCFLADCLDSPAHARQFSLTVYLGNGDFDIFTRIPIHKRQHYSLTHPPLPLGALLTVCMVVSLY
jgi:hypothetical protein